MRESERRRFERIKKVIDDRLKGHKAFTDPSWTPPLQWKADDCGEQPLPEMTKPLRRLTTRQVRPKRQGVPSSDYLFPFIRMRPEAAYDKDAGGTDFSTAWRHTLCHEIVHSRGLRTAFGWFWPITYFVVCPIIGAAVLVAGASKLRWLDVDVPTWTMPLAGAIIVLLMLAVPALRAVEEMVAEMGAVVLAHRVRLIKQVRAYSVDYIAGYERGIPWPFRGIARRFAWREARRRVSREPTRHRWCIGLVLRFQSLWPWG